MSDEGEEIFVPYHSAWLDAWAEQDFSWEALANLPAWDVGNFANLQVYLRAYEKGADDDQLLAQKTLIDCGTRGIFHVLFVPEEWAASDLCPDLTPDGLSQSQRHYWQRLRSDWLREHFGGTIRGVHLYTEIAQELVAGTRASFDWTRLHGDLRGVLKRGDRSFYACHFLGNIRISERLGDPLNHGLLHFTSCQFDSQVILAEPQGIQRLEFNTCNLADQVRIDDCSIGAVRFDNCVVSYLGADETTFESEFVLGESSINQIECSSSRFNDHVLAVGTEFQRSVNFLGCDFTDRVTLSDISWPTETYLVASSSGSKFFGIVSVDGGSPPPVQFFQNAEFASKVAFRGYSDRARREAFKKELQPSTSRDLTTIDQGGHAEAIESGCRTLRKRAEVEGDVQTEHLWHRNELIARRARGESTLSEKISSHLYEWLADYGLSISRPFLVLGWLVLLFGLLYGWLGGDRWIGTFDYESVQEGLGYSLNRTIPIGVFADDGNVWRKNLLGHGGQFGSIAVRALATAQTLMSAVLIYLGVMAVRRKFRIS